MSKYTNLLIGIRNTGIRYKLGIGTSVNYQAALRWLKKAAEHGDQRAMIELADIYNKGMGVTISKLEAFNWLVKAADSPPNGEYSRTARKRLRWIDRELYEQHCKRKDEQAKQVAQLAKQQADELNMQLLRDQATNDDAHAMHKLAVILMQQSEVKAEKDEEIIKWTKKAVELNHAGAMYLLGCFMLNGQYIDKNQAKGFELILKAHEMGFKGIEEELGMLYLNGIGTNVNVQRAQSLLNKQENQHYLEFRIRNGERVGNDDDNAAEVWESWADNGDKEAAYKLGIWYFYNGLYKLPIDSPEKSIKYLKVAASRGVVDAMVMLGEIHQNGIRITFDPDESIYWYEEAKKHGYINSDKMIGEVKSRLEYTDFVLNHPEFEDLWLG